MPLFTPRFTTDVGDDGEERIGSDVAGPAVEVPNFDGSERGYLRTRADGSDDYNTFSISVQNNQGGILVLGEDPQRLKARVWAATTGIVLGKEGQVASGNGALLLANMPFEFTSWKPLYANLVQGDGTALAPPITMYVIVERNTAV